MDIVGGIYRELCESPRWDKWLGSGGRAACALSGWRGRHVLHSYVTDEQSKAVESFETLGVRVCAMPASHNVAFSYLHPLSRPGRAIVGSGRERALAVTANAILRFGFVEGDAQVIGDRVVYDPQTRDWAPFHANGSTANTLALVLNVEEAESRLQAKCDLDGALQLLEIEAASILVLKKGPDGADVYSRDGKLGTVPVYRTERVFKIGSGDVFSAVFAYLWAEERRAPEEAADLASRAVAQYVMTSTLPLPPEKDWVHLGALIPDRTSRRAAVFGDTETLAGRWLALEAESCLRLVGMEVVPSQSQFDVSLVLADMCKSDKEFVMCSTGNEPVVWFSEQGASPWDTVNGRAQSVSDFCSAIYWTSWKARP